MANSSNRTIYIIGGIILLVVAVPVIILLLGFLAGFIFYFQSGAN